MKCSVYGSDGSESGEKFRALSLAASWLHLLNHPHQPDYALQAVSTLPPGRILGLEKENFRWPNTTS